MATVISTNADKIEKARKADSKMVKGKFLCHKPKGGSMKFSYRKYKGDPIRTYTLDDGKEYEIPIGVAKNINNCGEYIHSNIMDSQGNPMVDKKGKKDYRCSFQNSDLM